MWTHLRFGEEGPAVRVMLIHGSVRPTAHNKLPTARGDQDAVGTAARLPLAN